MDLLLHVFVWALLCPLVQKHTGFCCKGSTLLPSIRPLITLHTLLFLFFSQPPSCPNRAEEQTAPSAHPPQVHVDAFSPQLFSWVLQLTFHLVLLPEKDLGDRWRNQSPKRPYVCPS